MALLDATSPTALRVIFPLFVGIGFSFLLKLPNEVLNIALADKHMASATGNFFLVRFIGATTGLSISAAIFGSQAKRLVAPLEGHYSFELDLSTVDWRSLKDIQPADLRNEVLSAVSHALSVSDCPVR